MKRFRSVKVCMKAIFISLTISCKQRFKMLFEILIFLIFFRWVLKLMVTEYRSLQMNSTVFFSTNRRHCLENILTSFSVIVSMWILIPAFTMQQETVSKYFIKRELRDWKTVNRFVRLRTPFQIDWTEVQQTQFRSYF